MPMVRKRSALAAAVVVLLLSIVCGSPPAFLPGGRVLLDAHNAYPYEGRWADRIDRALATGVPLAIEQDLAFCTSEPGARREPVVTHEDRCHGGEPTLRAYFFERIRPIMERALAEGPSAHWPLVTLNLDFKTNEPEHHRAVWSLLGEHERWLTTAPRPEGARDISPLTPGPLLVLTGAHDTQQQTFFASVPAGGTLRLFGAVATLDPDTAGALPRPGPPSAYRRWWNHPWRIVEAGGPRQALTWRPEEAARLEALTRTAHRAGLWLRLYTLNGHPAEDAQGWFDGYNFGTREAAAIRWRAAIDAGVDFIATDQYEGLAGELARRRPAPGGR